MVRKLKVNCFLLVAQEPWGSWILFIKRGHNFFFLDKKCDFHMLNSLQPGVGDNYKHHRLHRSHFGKLLHLPPLSNIFTFRVLQLLYDCINIQMCCSIHNRHLWGNMCLRIFTHAHAASFYINTRFCEINVIFFHLKKISPFRQS